MGQPIRILVAPLDWGLGHATRCLPVISALEQAGAAPLLASAGNAGEYLQQERPELPFFELPGYGIRYQSGNMVWNMATQLPGIWRTIQAEHSLLQRLIRQHRIQAVISDNRYGCWSGSVPSVFIGHQLQLQLPFWLSGPVNAVHRRMLRSFSACWIPDVPGAGNLSGALSVPHARLQTRHIGHLSRFTGKAEEQPQGGSFTALALLSGPEPQRSRLEAEVLSQMQSLPGRYIVAGGRAGEVVEWSRGNVYYYSRLGTAALLPLLAKAEVVLCRSGYSSLMDLAALGKRALLIPTPGQTEQLYLAARLEQQGKAVVQQQGQLALGEGLAAAKRLPGLQQQPQCRERLKAAVKELIILAAAD